MKFLKAIAPRDALEFVISLLIGALFAGLYFLGYCADVLR